MSRVIMQDTSFPYLIRSFSRLFTYNKGTEKNPKTKTYDAAKPKPAIPPVL